MGFSIQIPPCPARSRTRAGLFPSRLTSRSRSVPTAPCSGSRSASAIRAFPRASSQQRVMSTGLNASPTSNFSRSAADSGHDHGAERSNPSRAERDGGGARRIEYPVLGAGGGVGPYWRTKNFSAPPRQPREISRLADDHPRALRAIIGRTPAISAALLTGLCRICP